MKLIVLFALAFTCAQAQWVKYPEPGVPRLRDGTVNLKAPPPRTREGKPDLSGVWMHEITTVAEVRRLFGDRFEAGITLAPPGMEIGTQHKYWFDLFVDFKPGEVQMRPQAEQLMRRRAAESDPSNVCGGTPGGFFRADLLSEPIKIVQAPRMTIILYEVGNLHRQIYTDGRPLPKEFDFPSFLGYSTGRWEGDTLVVETAGFNGQTALDAMGHPHSEKLRVTERFRRRDFGHLDMEITFDDPVMYNKPFTVKIPHYLVPDTDIFEMFCENEKDRIHLKKN
ncbi:MAG: hypothetical protein EXQ47_06895 [Bryobacterales bacterium]|nr:hypothetical protein [Bryobacterales bacterium]